MKLTVTVMHCNGSFSSESYSPRIDTLRALDKGCMDERGEHITLKDVVDLAGSKLLHRKHAFFFQDHGLAGGYGQFFEPVSSGGNTSLSGRVRVEVTLNGEICTEEALQEFLKEPNTMPNPKNAGRKRLPESERTHNKSITLTAAEWEALAAMDADGVPSRAAVRIIREYLQQLPKITAV